MVPVFRLTSQTKHGVEQIGRALVLVGVSIALLGALVWLGAFKWLRLGRLPGDIVYERDGVGVYFPIVTMLLISGVITLIVWIVGVIKR